MSLEHNDLCGNRNPIGDRISIRVGRARTSLSATNNIGIDLVKDAMINVDRVPSPRPFLMILVTLK